MRIRNVVLGALMFFAMAAPLAGQAQGARRADQDIIITLRNAGTFRMFLQAVEVAGMTQQLRSSENLTVFAPTDDAFGRIPGGRRDSLLRDRVAVEALVRNHVVEGRLTADQARAGGSGMSFMGGAGVKVETAGARIKVNGAQVIKPDLQASNGIIHVVDQVWLPPLTGRVRGSAPGESEPRPGSASHS
jgi:uncharacterized surface protein with fasciclin (FAS1) repeats